MLKKILRWITVAGIAASTLAASANPALAQDGSGQGQNYQVKIAQVDTSHFPQVTVWVEVTDAQGNPVPLLPDSAFTLTENGQPVQIKQVNPGGEQSQSPVTVVLVIDRSGSMLQSGKLEGAKAAANKFVDLMRPQDKSGVIAFNTRVDTLQGLTSDTNALHKAINSIQAVNDTALYDALSASTDMLQGVEGRRAIILLSDGLDNRSKVTSAEVIKSVEAAQGSVYAIGLGDPSKGNSQAGIDEAALKNIADQSLGEYSFAPKPTDLESIYAGLSSRLQNEYSLTYITSNTLRDGVNRGLEVQVAQAPSVTAKYNPGGVIPETSSTLNWLVFGGLMVALLALLVLPGALRNAGGVGKALTPKKKSRIKLGGGAPQTGPKSKPGARKPSIRLQGKRS